MIPHAKLEEVPSFQASKWLKIPLFLAVEELEELFELLGQTFLVPLSGVVAKDMESLSKFEFYKAYREYLAEIGNHPKTQNLVLALTQTLDDLRKVQVDGGAIIRIYRPVIQIQPYTLHFSATSEQFIEMTHSSENFYWGLLFSYPQLFQDPQTDEVEKTQKGTLPNTQLFKTLQKWAREATIPTPFQFGDKIIYHPARIGKKLIAAKPKFSTLKKKGIELCWQN